MSYLETTEAQWKENHISNKQSFTLEMIFDLKRNLRIDIKEKICQIEEKL